MNLTGDGRSPRHDGRLMIAKECRRRRTSNYGKNLGELFLVENTRDFAPMTPLKAVNHLKKGEEQVKDRTDEGNCFFLADMVR